MLIDQGRVLFAMDEKDAKRQSQASSALPKRRKGPRSESSATVEFPSSSSRLGRLQAELGRLSRNSNVRFQKNNKANQFDVNGIVSLALLVLAIN